MPHADMPPSRSGPIREFARRRPLVTFLLLTFSLAWPFMWMIPLSSHGIVPLGEIEKPMSLMLVIVMLASATWVTWAEGGRDGLRRLFRRSFRWRIGWIWYAVILLGLPVMGLAAGLALGGTIKPDDLPQFLLEQGWILLYTFALVNLWEETVWTGFFQTRVEERHNIVAGAFLSAIPFAGVHIPLAFVGDISLAGIAISIVALIFLCTIFRFMLAAVLRGTGDSLLAIGLLHAIFNRTNNGDGILAGLLSGPNRGLCALIAVILLGAGTAICVRHKLSRRYRLEHLEAVTHRDAESRPTTAAARIREKTRQA